MTVGDLWPEPPRGRPLPLARPAGLVSGSLVKVRAEWIGFYDTHYHRVVRFVMHAAGASQASAEDAAGEAFTESWKLMTRDPAAWAAVADKAAWVRKVALRRHARPPGTRRRLLTDEPREIPDWPAPGPGHAELTAQAQAVLQALLCLDSEARAVMAFSFDDFTTAEISSALAITQQRVRDVKKKARETLKRQLAAAAEAGRRQP